MKDNRGLTLVEILVVIALIAIMGTFVYIGMGLLTGQDARECANNISAALSKEKTYSMTRSATVDCYMELVYKSDGYYVRYYQPANATATGTNSTDWVLADEEKVGKQNVSVTCEFEGGGGIYEIKTNKSVKFIYDRTSGAFKKAVKSNGTTIGTETGTDYCTNITIQRTRIYDIELYSATGKHELNRVD